MIKVFVYGILRTWFPFDDSDNVGGFLSDHTKEIGVGGFFTVNPKRGSVVSGRVLTVDEATLAEFDRIEGYPNFYNRKVVTVCLEDTGELVDAWVYYQVNRY